MKHETSSKLVRLNTELTRQLKIRAAENNLTMRRLLDGIVSDYFKRTKRKP